MNTLSEQLISRPDHDYITIRTHGTYLSVPKAIYDSWTPRQLAWAHCKPTVGNSNLIDRYVEQAFDVYKFRSTGVKPLKALPPKVVGRFQFWLRANLERYGLI